LAADFSEATEDEEDPSRAPDPITRVARKDSFQHRWKPSTIGWLTAGGR